ncbi:DUF3089 domain-containing protein [Chitinophaga sedimenti]|uniref:DUF3089 domain-containing protein n=1 Tax=Chitinophaga sedimenti TaxID=2033606 RepID=UPI0020052131|nr:DUF3089 domain-containing protein [Chitinophaga sedimenti]MCK7556510.1 DUF3089 domain-containing protein [Chitinophaga sedimenti]
MKYLTAFLLLLAQLVQAQRTPDYNNLNYWAAHPWRVDASDSVPQFLKGEVRDTAVDVFFLHPTSFVQHFRKAPLIADIDDPELNELTERQIIKLQATIFNAHTRVFAPYYRQAHLKAFFQQDQAAASAFDTAYSDLKAAFQYYLKHYNHGRPIIIAAHSRGAMHGIRLLQEFFDGRPLQKQLVCAYLVGWRVGENDFKHIPPGTSPTQTGCVLTWRTYENKFISKSDKATAEGALCINPLTWLPGNEWSDKSAYKGAPDKHLKKKVNSDIRIRVHEKYHVVWVKGYNELSLGLPGIGRFAEAIGNLHLFDLNLFYLNVRENVKQRIDAYRAAHPTSFTNGAD